jgi:hypothetical protein
MAAMQTARDVILVIRAVISMACILYIAFALDTAPLDPETVEMTPLGSLEYEGQPARVELAERGSAA